MTGPVTRDESRPAAVQIGIQSQRMAGVGLGKDELESAVAHRVTKLAASDPWRERVTASAGGKNLDVGDWTVIRAMAQASRQRVS